MSYPSANLPYIFNDKSTGDVAFEFRYDKESDNPGPVVYLHKIILSTSATYFKDCLSEIGNSSDNTVSILYFPFPCQSIIQMLRIMYRCNDNINSDQICDLILLGDYLGLNQYLWEVIIDAVAQSINLNINKQIIVADVFKLLMVSNIPATTNLLKIFWNNYEDTCITYCLSQPDEWIASIPACNIYSLIFPHRTVTQHMLRFVNHWGNLYNTLTGIKPHTDEFFANEPGVNKIFRNNVLYPYPYLWCRYEDYSPKFIESKTYLVNHAHIPHDIKLVDHRKLFSEEPVSIRDIFDCDGAGSDYPIWLTKKEVLDCFGADFISIKKLWKIVPCGVPYYDNDINDCIKLINKINWYKSNKSMYKFRKVYHKLMNRRIDAKKYVEKCVKYADNKLSNTHHTFKEQLELGIKDKDVFNIMDTYINYTGNPTMVNQLINIIREKIFKSKPISHEMIQGYILNIAQWVDYLKESRQATETGDLSKFKQLMCSKYINIHPMLGYVKNIPAEVMNVLTVQVLTCKHLDIVKHYIELTSAYYDYTDIIHTAIKLSADEILDWIIDNAPDNCNFIYLFAHIGDFKRKIAIELIFKKFM